MNNRGGILKGLFIFLLIVITLLVVLAFMVPGLIFSRDLGIDYRKADYDSAIDKLSSALGNDNYVKISLTSVELTALANEKCLINCPYKDAQIKINDNDLEIVAKVSRDYILEKFVNVEPNQTIETKYPILKVLPKDVNIYIKVDGYILENVVAIDSITVYIQGVLVPSDYFIGNKLESFVSRLNETLTIEKSKHGLNIKTFEFSKDNLMIEGTLPDNFKVE